MKCIKIVIYFTGIQKNLRCKFCSDTNFLYVHFRETLAFVSVTENLCHNIENNFLYL